MKEKKDKDMGAVTKFNKTACVTQLRHVERKIKYPKNTDIDLDRTYQNYKLSPNRGISSYKYLKERISEVYLAPMGKYEQDRIYMSGWIITKPKDLDDIYERDFFEVCYEFLKERYGGEKNVINASVHKDESGEPHLHFCFIPVKKFKYTPDKNKRIALKNWKKVHEYLKDNPNATSQEVAEVIGLSRKTVARWRRVSQEEIENLVYDPNARGKNEKLCAKEVINRQDLQTFHQDLQSYIDKKKIPAKVYTGITKAQGGNITVEELKRQREYLKRHEHIEDRRYEHEY